MLSQKELTLTVTILGCCAFNKVLISRKEVIGKPSLSFSIFNRFNATISSEKQKQKPKKALPCKHHFEIS